LLGNVEARPLRFDHVDEAAQVTFGAPQALNDLGMTLVDSVLIHELIHPRPLRRYDQAEVLIRDQPRSKGWVAVR
jgi:hypothetical protein